MIGVNTRGSDKTSKSLKRIQDGDIYSELAKYGQMGVDALARATPRESGETANSWGYIVTKGRKKSSIQWINTNEAGDVNVAILLQYGHGTGTGGYVEGKDYINPAIKPIFDRIAEAVWYEVKTA